MLLSVYNHVIQNHVTKELLLTNVGDVFVDSATQINSDTPPPKMRKQAPTTEREIIQITVYVILNTLCSENTK